MAKKKTNYMSYLPLAAVLLGIVAIVMLFVPAVVASEDVSYTGLQVVFGYSEKTDIFGSQLVTEMLSFSFMNLLPYILVLVGVVCCVLAFMNPKNKLFAFVAFVCFVVAAVFFFLAVSFTIPAEGWEELAGALNTDIKADWTLGAGAIVAGITSALSALVVAGSAVLNK